MPDTWPAMARRKETSSPVNSRNSTDCTFRTPTNRGPDSMGTESIEWKRSSSRPGTHFQCSSCATSVTRFGSLVSATQPVMPSPSRIVTLPTIRSLSPFVAVRTSSCPPSTSRYSEQTSVPIAEVVSRMIRSSSWSEPTVDAADRESRWRNSSSRKARRRSRSRTVRIGATWDFAAALAINRMVLTNEREQDWLVRTNGQGSHVAGVYETRERKGHSLCRTFVRYTHPMVGCFMVSRFPLACELADNPELVGHTVAFANEDGSLLANSPEAEANGVRLAQKLREAIGRCPTLIVLNGRPALYQAQAEAILRALELVAFTVEPAAQGQAYMDLAELRTCYPSTEAIAVALLACAPPALEPRLGAAATRFGALLAARAARAGGSIVVSDGELPSFLASQPVEALPVSAETLRRLRLLKLETLGELKALPRSALAAQFGPEGALASGLARGTVHSPLSRRPRLVQVVEWLHLETPLVSHPAILAAWKQTLSRALRQPAFRGHAARQAELRGTPRRGGRWVRAAITSDASASLWRLVG